MTITSADVMRDVTAAFIQKSPSLEGSLTILYDPKALHDWEAHGSCVSVSITIRTSPFDPKFRIHIRRAYRAACLLHQELILARTMRH